MQWLKPDITVITNVRQDHEHELGTVEEAAQIFAQAIPNNSVTVTSEGNFIDTWKTAAKQKNSKLVFVAPEEAESLPGAFPENIACILGVADHLGIERSQALIAIAEHKPDTGAFTVHKWEYKDHPIFFADARAANDIESTERLYASAIQMLEPAMNFQKILLLVNREDRPDRARLFLQYIINRHMELRFDQYLCLGLLPLSFRNTLKRKGVNYKTLKSTRDMDDLLVGISQPVFIFAVGNYGGPGLLISRWLQKERQ
jgi:poly-gamma-glutamate synthase PgsB/CapB